MFKRLFSSADTVSKTVDAVIRSGDAMFFTEEEKSVAAQKRLDWLLKFHEKSSGSNLARRLLAVMMVGVFLALVLVTAGMIYFEHPQIDPMKAFISDTLVQPVSVITVFYFGVAAITQFKK